MLKTTVGQLLVNEALPPEMRDYNRIIDKKTSIDLLRQVAEQYPDQYPDVSKSLLLAGQDAAIAGNFSFSIKDLVATGYRKKRRIIIAGQVQKIVNNPKLDTEEKNRQIIVLLSKEIQPMTDAVLEEGVQNGSRLAEVVRGGSKGKPAQYNIMVGSPLMYTDHLDNPIPIPVLNSASDGFDPVEYWASAYGARKGAISSKFSVRDSGYFSKKLALALQRSVITEDDCETKNGISVQGDDTENLGTVLQTSIKGLKSNSIIRPEHLPFLKGKEVQVRSPITCQAREGLCAKCAGIRETGRLPDIGDNVGMSAALAFGERLSQSSLNVKHFGGVAGAKRQWAFKDIVDLFEMPEHSRKAAAVADLDGVVKSVIKSPAGGTVITVNDIEHWVPPTEEVRVKRGDVVEAGDILSSGIPNAKKLAQYRGIGDARIAFLNQMKDVAGASVSRRNGELIARSMINHVKLTSDRGVGDGMIGDVFRYDALAKDYEPKASAQMAPTGSAHGKYLEEPVSHYTIGTRINNRVQRDLKGKGVMSIKVSDEAPDFDADVQRLYEHSQYDPDWLVRLSGYRLKDNLLEGVHQGDTSQVHSTSFVPALAKGVDFGAQINKGIY